MIEYSTPNEADPECEEQEVQPGEVPPLKWSIALAGREFSISRTTLCRRLALSQDRPDKGGNYTTRQIAMAVYGDLHAARLGQIAAATSLDTLKLQKLKGELLSRTLLAEAIDRIFSALKAKIMGLTEIPHRDRIEIVGELAGLPLTLSAVADRQTRSGLDREEARTDFGEADNEIDPEDALSKAQTVRRRRGRPKKAKT
jgi:hypothetical protein